MSKPRSKLINYAGRQFRQAYGFTTEIHFGKQAKHMPGQTNYDPSKSTVTLPIDTIQDIVEHYAGTGTRIINSNKEVVDFKIPIGYYTPEGGHEKIPTTRGIIHFSKSGAHIAPAEPAKES